MILAEDASPKGEAVCGPLTTVGVEEISPFWFFLGPLLLLSAPERSDRHVVSPGLEPKLDEDLSVVTRGATVLISTRP